jgi:hypothetical protein
LSVQTYEVGEPYIPDRRVWPEGATFSYRAGEFVLTLFLNTPDHFEVEAIRSGRCEFTLYDEDNLVILGYSFMGDHGNVAPSYVPYQWHVTPEAERFPVPDPAKLVPGSRVVLTVLLVNASGGVIGAVRPVSLSPEFTRRLCRAITHQAAGPWDSAEYDRKVQALRAKFPTGSELAPACRFRMEDGS